MKHFVLWLNKITINIQVLVTNSFLFVTSGYKFKKKPKRKQMMKILWSLLHMSSTSGSCLLVGYGISLIVASLFSRFIKTTLLYLVIRRFLYWWSDDPPLEEILDFSKASASLPPIANCSSSSGWNSICAKFVLLLPWDLRLLIHYEVQALSATNYINQIFVYVFVNVQENVEVMW